MGLIKWIKRELDSTNSCKRRQSEPPISGESSQFPRDESYVKALSKFNEWRQRQLFGGTARLSRKQSKKIAKNRGHSDSFIENRSVTSDKEFLPKIVTNTDNSLYEEIQVNQLEHHKNDISPSLIANNTNLIPIRHSYPTTDITKPRIRRNSCVRHTDDLQIYENAIVELVNQFDRSPDIVDISKHLLSPPVKFFKENSNPFADVRTPNREQEIEKPTQDWMCESPNGLEPLDALRAAFKPFTEDDSTRDSTSSNGKFGRNPPYQTVINKHGDEVEYALPLNEKLDEDEKYYLEGSKETYCRVETLNDTSRYQHYVNGNFKLLNEKERLGASRMSVSFGRNQFRKGNVIVTDLDKTSGTKETEDQNNSKEHDIIEELEALELWSRNITENIESNPVLKTKTNMHFAEIIVCSSNEVTENEPREVFETMSGTLHSGTFHCVLVTQFKPLRRELLYADSALQLNFEVLRKIRHPDIALLMGITVDNKCALDSLILEPLNYSLNHFIHEEGGCIPISVCLMYTLQINSAVTYLHKHRLVHSNISTHSIVMCNLSKSVKLTSFELTTAINEELKNELTTLFQNDNQQVNNATHLPYNLRPYNVGYRKAFSKHNYQAPELLSNRFPFVFPTIQCDVYGICLTLWEMIHCATPFVDFNYDEMIKLIYLQNAQLPMLQDERQNPFVKALQLGLNMVPEKRISDTIKLNELLRQVPLDLAEKINAPNSEEKIYSINDASHRTPNALSPKGFGPTISERTSTIKKRKNIFGENRLAAQQLFVYSQIEKCKRPSDVMIPSHTSSPNSPGYGFDIGEVSIPETPIARSNKLRKTAWLSNQSISPIVHLEIKSKDDAVNDIQMVENKRSSRVSSEDKSLNKMYNVNIRIRPNSKKNRTPSKNDESLTANSSPGQPQRNSSQISDHIKFFNLVSKSNQSLSNTEIKTPSPDENYKNFNKNGTKPTSITENILNKHPETPISQKGINDFFSRSQPSADFEKSLWRREKQKCDQSVKSPRRISVKDAVNKFESFSKSMLSESSSPKSKRILPSTSPITDENKEEPPNLDRPQNNHNSEESISKINIILRNNGDSSCKDKQNQNTKQERVEIQPESCKIANELKQSPMLTLNFKKLDRRASDLGSYYIRQNPNGKALTTRHSIYGTEIFKRLRKAKPTTETEGEDMKEGKTNKTTISTNVFQDNKNDFKIKVGKLTCQNCGHKLFVVDDVVPSNSSENVTNTCTEMLLTPLARNVGSQGCKSTEDFYIDDDFCGDIELCANMELGTRSHLSGLIDFDILCADIFNPTEEKANKID